MYAKLVYNADAANTTAQMLIHIGELLTGTTAIGSLTGGNIDSVNSEIDVSYYTPAFTLHDDISATNKVYRIPVHDDAATTFFYLEFTVSGTDLDMQLWEEWDEVTTHAGTNGTYYTSSGFEFISNLNFATVDFTLYFSITATHCIARSVYNNGTKKYLRGFMQYERKEAWDTVANGYIPAVVTYLDNMGLTSSQLYALPHKRSDDSVYSGSGALMYLATAYGNCQKDSMSLLLGSNASSARGLDASYASVHNMYEMGFSFLSSGERFLTGKTPDMYYATYANGTFGDEISVNSNTYIIWEGTISTYRYAVRKG